MRLARGEAMARLVAHDHGAGGEELAQPGHPRSAAGAGDERPEERVDHRPDHRFVVGVGVPLGVGSSRVLGRHGTTVAMARARPAEPTTAGTTGTKMK